MRIPSHNTLCSFVFSLLLTSALIPSSSNVSLAAAGAPAAQMAATAVLNGLRAQGLAGGAEVALPSPAATPAAVSPVSSPAPTLTPEIMVKLTKLVADKGVDRELIPLVANTLGLTPAGQTWASRSVSYTETNGTGHSFYISRTADPDLVIALNVPGKTYGFRLHRDGTAVAAFVFDIPTRQITMLTSAEAQKSTDGQVAFWTGLVANPQTASN